MREDSQKALEEPKRKLEEAKYKLEQSIKISKETEEKDFNNIISIGIRSFYLAIRSNTETSKKLCDLVIQPIELVNIPLFATWKAKEAIEIGYTFAKELIKEQIRK
jgi:hypothetical protein